MIDLMKEVRKSKNFKRYSFRAKTKIRLFMFIYKYVPLFIAKKLLITKYFKDEYYNIFID